MSDGQKKIPTREDLNQELTGLFPKGKGCPFESFRKNFDEMVDQRLEDYQSGKIPVPGERVSGSIGAAGGDAEPGGRRA